MKNNIKNHISDASEYVTFDPANTQWPANVTHVQGALSLVGAWARTDIGLPIASEAVAGIASIATEAEITAGTDDEKIVTPRKLKFALLRPEATEDKLGLTRYATLQEALTDTVDDRSITPKKLDHVFKNRPATETDFGVLRVATQNQAELGNVDDAIMTPLKVKQAIAALSTVYGNATESAFGIVRLATVAQVQDGKIREGYAISPYTFDKLQATSTKSGTVKLAVSSDMPALTEQFKVITPAALGTLKANTSQFGIVKLTQTPGNDANTALAANALVVPNTRTINGKSLAGDISINSGDVNCFNRQESDSRYLLASNAPSGSMIRAGTTTDYTIHANGRYQAITVECMAKFNPRDGTTSRYAIFAIHHNGQEIYRRQMNCDVWKGGSRGHYWGYEGYASAAQTIGRHVNPGDSIRAVIIGSSYLNSNSFTISLSS